MDFQHIPVLKDEVIEGLNIDPHGVYVDGTLGGGGHSGEILKRLEDGFLVGIDRDESALKAAEKHLQSIGGSFQLVKGNFVDMPAILKALHIDKVDGILLDIGVSSHQFDTAERGFSYRFDGPLDMRMDKDAALSAYDIVNTYSEKTLAKIIKTYGEERWGDRIAEFIVKERKEAPIASTFELVSVIKKAIPKKVRLEGGHPAKKTFQALRIVVNRELDVLESSIPEMVRLLKPGGRLAIITFHSLEDRIVKNGFQYLYKDCICPPRQPICTCNKKREIEIVTRKPITAREEELERNHRSHSAKLRIAEKI
ncbi:MAG: 16S rRNA (cytosine(1402)-N(4))-methyltransferase RsmH [Peptoniphilus sp.]|nr:16S rRNA (cytosine(1402)-N(4))-methyltransferase RsmH [Peptoniphilus sp.]MDY3118606.1 16S rRNA (cytosine(1402)-N(4))-methyltransferase RsmH [Peptoniphilus sp.]